MTWYAWVMVTLIVLSTLITVSRVGEPRKPLDGGDAAVVVLVQGLFIWGIITLAERAG